MNTAKVIAMDDEMLLDIATWTQLWGDTRVERSLQCMVIKMWASETPMCVTKLH